MRSWMIAYCLGIAVVARFPSLPPISLLLFSLTGAGLMLSFCLGKSYLVPTRIALTVLVFLMGLSWHCLWADALLQQRLPSHLEGQDMLVTGEIVSIPEHNGRYQQIKFHIEYSDLGFSDRLILLNVYGDQQLIPHQRWQLTVRLNQPHGFANPGGFDYEAWLFQQGINAKGYVRESESNILLARPGLSGLGLRFVLLQKLSRLSADLEFGGVVVALAMGDKSQLSQQQWQLFSATGTNHLMVISGLHVGFVAGMFYLLFNRLMRRVPTFLLVFPAQKSAAVVAILAALVYSFLAGFSLPTQRAVIMISVYMASIVLSRNVAPATSLGLAAVIVLSLNPLSVASAGFWLSFVAVAGLLLSVSRTNTSVWSKFIKPQLTVFVALLVPLSMWLQQITFMAPLANFLAIPLISLVVVPLCLGAMLIMLLSEPVALLLLTGIDWLLALLVLYLNWLSDLQPSLSNWNFNVVYSIAYFCAALSCGLLLLPLKTDLRWLSLPLLAPLFLPRVAVLQVGEIALHIVDVGQGLAVVLQSTNHALVYDAGPEFSEDFSAGSAVLYPTLQALGINKVDKLVVSHGDNDHAGGVKGLLDKIQVDEIFSSAALNGISRLVKPCRQGQQWDWDEVSFTMLHPDSEQDYSANDRSCVLQVSLADKSLLLPGDIEVKAERRLLRDYGAGLNSAVLIAPHHGSNTSSSLSFVARVQPALVIYSSGYQNRFGHPTARIQQHYEQVGAQSYTTSEDGMISLNLRPGEPLHAPSRYRYQRRRYWQASLNKIQGDKFLTLPYNNQLVDDPIDRPITGK